MRRRYQGSTIHANTVHKKIESERLRGYTLYPLR